MDKNTFSQILAKINVEINDNQFEQFNRYYEILVEWNEFMNLTGITDYDEVQIKHFVDSLAIKKALVDISAKNKEFGELLAQIDADEVTAKKDSNNLDQADNNTKNPLSIIDVGTGAGFPGLPLKIAFSGTEVMLLDSLNKRVKFLNEVITQLGLEGIAAVHARAEDAAKNVGFREIYDVGVSRAVANLATLSEYLLPFVKVGGYFIAYKSGDIDTEAAEAKKAIQILGGEVKEIYKFTIPDTDIERSFVFIKKVKNTPKKYPRKAGVAAKEPIK